LITKCDLLVLKICKTPKKFDEKLETNVKQALYVILMLHLMFAIWVYGNASIFGDQEAVEKSNQLISKIQNNGAPYLLATFFNRAIAGQNIILTILLAFYAGGIIVKYCLQGTAERIENFCCKKTRELNSWNKKYQNMVSYYDRKKKLFLYNVLVLTPEQLRQENKYLNYEIHRINDIKLMMRLMDRQKKIQERLISRQRPEEDNDLNKEKSFQGLFSYWIGVIIKTHFLSI